MARTTLQQFVDYYEVKNGYIGSEDTLNKAVHQAKLELNELWNWCSGGNDVVDLPDGSINQYLINDNKYNDIIGTKNTVVRSAEWCQVNLFDTTATQGINDSERGWSSATIWKVITGTSDLGDTKYNGGTW